MEFRRWCGAIEANPRAGTWMPDDGEERWGRWKEGAIVKAVVVPGTGKRQGNRKRVDTTGIVQSSWQGYGSRRSLWTQKTTVQ